MKLLVTGGNGGVGRTLVSTLIHSGHSVRVFDRSAAPQPHAAVEHIIGDLYAN
jgi:nucleoside-diphosphate-sugar epimerase